MRWTDKYLVERNRARHLRLDEIILAWFERRPGRKPVSVACELAVVRQFYTFLRRHGRRGLHEPLWPRLPSTSGYVPYVLSPEEVQRLPSLTVKLREPFRRITCRTLILVLYCTGLRFGEALRLRDVEVARGTLFVVASKGRSRRVPCLEQAQLEPQMPAEDELVDVHDCSCLSVARSILVICTMQPDRYPS